jgi:hypothetical protein
MALAYLLIAGGLVSIVHAYLVWFHRDDRKQSLSEHVILTGRSHLIYFVSHVVCEILFILFSYQLYRVEHHLPVLFYLNMIFVVLDFVQAAIPARGKTEIIHMTAAYVSWCCYLISGTLALFKLNVMEPFAALSLVFLIPTLAMFLYVHVRRKRLWFYQLLIVPGFVVYMMFVVIGAK